jgi:pyruvate kinase
MNFAIRKTKIVATIGPASDSVETLQAMIKAGMNVARLNLSHGTFKEHRRRIARIREASANVDQPVAVMIDTRGVEIRTGRIEGNQVELPMADVPSMQKKIIRVTVSNGKPVITATQMLASMEKNPKPTHAEASDVANAILDGSSAIMLSGESALGDYPVEAVKTMDMLTVRTEVSLREYGYLQQILPHPSNVVTEAIGHASVQMADRLKAAAIISLTESGLTSRLVSKHRPECPILAVTITPSVVRRLCMNWGVVPIQFRGAGTDDDKIAHCIEVAKHRGMVNKGDIVIATSGSTQAAGGTNLIRVLRVE